MNPDILPAARIHIYLLWEKMSGCRYFKALITVWTLATYTKTPKRLSTQRLLSLQVIIPNMELQTLCKLGVTSPELPIP